MNSNPFNEDFVPLTPGIPQPLSVRKKENVSTSLEATRMSPSPSLPNVQPFTFRHTQPREQNYRSPAPPRSDIKNDELKIEAGTAARGRTPYRPASPSHVSRDPSIDAAKAQKRSRSPVKKLLGLGKSTSLKNIASEPRSKSNSTSPDKGRTTPLRVWGNRFRHGFLVEIPLFTYSLNKSLTVSRPRI